MLTALLMLIAPVEPVLPAEQAARAPAPAPAPAVVVDTAAAPVKKPAVSCREVMMSSSRLGTIKVCKTRAQWARYDACFSSVTRYCSPKKRKEASLFNGASRPNESLRVACKTITATGSRLVKQKMCMTKGEWDRLHRDTSSETTNEVMRFSKQPNRGCGPTGCI